METIAVSKHAQHDVKQIGSLPNSTIRLVDFVQVGCKPMKDSLFKKPSEGWPSELLARVVCVQDRRLLMTLLLDYYNPETLKPGVPALGPLLMSKMLMLHVVPTVQSLLDRSNGKTCRRSRRIQNIKKYSQRYTSKWNILVLVIFDHGGPKHPEVFKHI